MNEDPSQLIAQAYATENMQTLHRALTAEVEVARLRRQVAAMAAQEQGDVSADAGDAPEGV